MNNNTELKNGPTPQDTIIVRRQWNDWCKGKFRLADLVRVHFSDMSGCVNAFSPRPF